MDKGGLVRIGFCLSLSLAIALLAAGCGGGGSGSGASSSSSSSSASSSSSSSSSSTASNATLNGTYAFASLNNNGLGGGSESASGAGALGTFAFNGSGDVTITIAYENSGGNVSTPTGTTPGTYSVSANGSVTITPSSGDALTGYVSADGNTVVVEDLASGDTTPSIAIAIKEGSGGDSSSSLQGTYALAALSNGQAGVGQGELGTITFGSSNGFTISNESQNSGGSISTLASISGIYSVAPDGSVTITPSGGGALTGNLSADGNTVVLEDVNEADAPVITVLIKEGGSNFTNASLSGVSSYSTLASGGANGDIGTVGSVTLDGQGNFSGTQSVNNGETIASNQSISGTYSVTANGSLTITQSGDLPQTGNVSVNGNTAVLEDLNSGDAPSIILVVH